MSSIWALGTAAPEVSRMRPRRAPAIWAGEERAAMASTARRKQARRSFISGDSRCDGE